MFWPLIQKSSSVFIRSHFSHQPYLWQFLLTCKTSCFKSGMLSYRHVLQPGEQHEEEAAYCSFTHYWGSLISSFVMLFPLTTQNSRVRTERRIACTSIGGIFCFFYHQILSAIFQFCCLSNRGMVLKNGSLLKWKRTWLKVTPRKHQPNTRFQTFRKYIILV